MDAFLCKWVIKALKDGNWNFKLLLGFNLVMCKPSWSGALKWIGLWSKITIHFQDQRYGGRFQRLGWKVGLFPSWITKAIKRVNIWWGFNFKGLEFGLSIPRAEKLYKSGLCTLKDLWRAKTKNFHSWDELKILFPLEKGEYSCWQ